MNTIKIENKLSSLRASLITIIKPEGKDEITTYTEVKNFMRVLTNSSIRNDQKWNLSSSLNGHRDALIQEIVKVY